ncbi:NAD-dependent epimerase/dehydratase family protein [Paenibacillus sp. SC116]|uniref:NAD-dependent epimerase/dehydratase family protein n=1 Tax=Paenibacillus sp. SC116 TaxID=2968986 RepID=UPI00215B0E78|nr:NAD-dependent epimerase/dehydratase family protein [Paenibacillus sp. SC116]MCR8845369.1 NAD-dependent epimerase/dehydratase family protein [Paenibacillus sp. SC116]
MRRILVMGGTRFFGKRLVQRLLENGDQVTIATRGITADSFGEQVQRVILDRADRHSVQAAAQLDEWDIVYDNICYSPEAAQYAVEAFEGRVGHYVFTSTLSVYNPTGRLHVESDFDPYNVGLDESLGEEQLSYQKGKQLCEAVFHQKAAFPVTSVRLPIVLGPDDYTKRLEYHLERVNNETPIYMPNVNAHMNYIQSREAASFLEWAGNQLWKGPINACSNGTISLAEVMNIVEQAVGKKAIMTNTGSDDARSPFGVPDSWLMDNSAARKAGFEFEELQNWLPPLAKELAAKL